MDWLAEPFSHAFMQRAAVAGILAAATTSLVGTWVVIRGLTFMGDALAHGVLPGIALAVLWGFDPMLGAAVSAILARQILALLARLSLLQHPDAAANCLSHPSSNCL